MSETTNTTDSAGNTDSDESSTLASSSASGSSDATTSETTPTADNSEDDSTDTEDDGADMFPRAYVEKLRRENASYRDRARNAEQLVAHANEVEVRLHTELVRATGRLADPEDLVFDEAHLEDSAALNQAIDELLAAKPHLANRRPKGDVGQGATRSNQPVDLAGMLRARA